jgi:two-component system KDP operon response regulator KdpE
VDQAQYLRVFIGQLRRKLERHPERPRFIITDPGVGYRFCTDPDPVG